MNIIVKSQRKKTQQFGVKVSLALSLFFGVSVFHLGWSKDSLALWFLLKCSHRQKFGHLNVENWNSPKKHFSKPSDYVTDSICYINRSPFFTRIGDLFWLATSFMFLHLVCSLLSTDATKGVLFIYLLQFSSITKGYKDACFIYLVNLLTGFR